MTRVFDPPADTVAAAVSCTWCGSGLASACTDRYGQPLEVPHAQRWRDYWNATHNPNEHIAVYADPHPGFRRLLTLAHAEWP